MEKKPKLVVQLQLPDDIESEILSRLPIKSLMRFRCVSKPWKALISHPAFQRQHFDRHSPHIPFPLNIQTFDNTNFIRINHFSTLLPPPPIRSRDFAPVNSCRGLVCFVNAAKVFICNPSTREILELPPPNCGATAGNYPTFCYPSTSNDLTFCYASTTSNQFKVINFFVDLSREGTQCEVFTLGTPAWRQISCSLPHNKYDFPMDDESLYNGTILHGALHFLPATDCPHGDVCVHRFNIETEEFTEIPLPHEQVEGSSPWQARYFMQLGGFLALSFNYGHTLDIWLLKDYNQEKWVKEYTIDLTDIDAISPAAILPDGGLLLNVNFASDRSGNVLCLYDPVLRVVDDTPQEDDLPWGMQLVESCFSPSPRVM